MKRLQLLACVCLLTACGDGGSSGSPLDPATHLSVTAPAMATAGKAFEITVTALDAANDVVAGYSGTVHFSSSDAQAVLPANARLTNGTGTFPATLRTAGSQEITATDTVTASIKGTASSIAVGPGPPTHFSVSASSSAQSGSPLDFTVTARDAADNVATGYTGTAHFSSSDAKAVLPANSTLTDGVGAFAATLLTAGNQTLTATDTVTASITGTSSSITVNAGPPTHLTVSAPTTVQLGMAFSFTVTALDAANNVAGSYSGTMHFSSSDARALLPANSTLMNGTASFLATLQTAGSQTVSATDTVTTSISGTSSSIDVSSTPVPFHFSISVPATAQSGTAFGFTVTALNAGNEVASNYTGTMKFSSSDAQALLPANATLKNGTGSFSATLQTAGDQTLAAVDTVMASIAGTSSPIDVTPGPATHLSVAAPSGVLPGMSFKLIVTARDAANNVAASYAGTVHFSSTDAKAVLPSDSMLTSGMGVFSAALQTTGSQTITATDRITASITGTSNPIDVAVNLCRTKGESCSLAPGGIPCCAGLRCIDVLPFIDAHACED